MNRYFLVSGNRLKTDILIHLCYPWLFRMIQPISIGYLIDHFDSPSTTDSYTATMAAIALLLSTLLCTIGMHQYMLGQVEIGFKIRVAVTTIIYSKVFCLLRTLIKIKM